MVSLFDTLRALLVLASVCSAVLSESLPGRSVAPRADPRVNHFNHVLFVDGATKDTLVTMLGDGSDVLYTARFDSQ